MQTVPQCVREEEERERGRRCKIAKSLKPEMMEEAFRVECLTKRD